MNEYGGPAASRPPSEPATADELRQDIEKTRTELADSVDALSSKLDVNAQVHKKIHRAKARAGESARRAGAAFSRSKEKAPAPIRTAADVTGRWTHKTVEKVGPIARQGAHQVNVHRKQVLAATGSVVLLLVGLRRKRGRAS